MRDPITCDCVCEPQACPAFAQWDETTCSCQCQSPLIYDAQSNTCECPSDTPYYFEDANLCCQSGYTPVDGVCQKIDCRGGPTSYNCYINDKLCGYNCDSFGRNCAMGICYADYCIENETFYRIPFSISGSYSYGCFKIKDKQISCARVHENRYSSWYCYLNDIPQEYCCRANNTTLECMNGTCENICPSDWNYKLLNGGSCTKDNLLCQYTLGTWTCYRNNVFCGSGCTDLDSCGTCQDIKSACAEGLTWNEEKQRCESNDMYCTAHTSLGYQQCYKYDGTKCGTYLATTAVFRPALGNCTDPGCPEGMTYGQVNSSYWGCIDAKIGNKGMACYYNGTYQRVCYYNGSLCGRRCDYDGTNCGMVYLPQCAQSGHCPQTGYDMSDGCTCDGDTTSVDGINYCCPAGHTYTNGVCAMT